MSQLSLKDFFKYIQVALPKSPGVFIVDDINVFVNLGFPVQTVIDFIHYCKVLSVRHVSFT